MTIRILFFIFLTIFCFSAKGGEAILYGTTSDWANSRVKFYTYSDLITLQEEIIGETSVSNEGKFELTIPVEKTTFIFTKLGIYRAYLYAEPGKRYELVLPQKIEKTQADNLNPYFQETHTQLGIVNLASGDVNMQIRMFNDMYIPYYNKHIIEAVQGKDFTNLDNDIIAIEKKFKENTNEFLKISGNTGTGH
ncbi:MAG: hypothetical protein HC906_00855 [Bacteroidales bacterium]|nr:hypothetical protein [Bacteroidales bacterium]